MDKKVFFERFARVIPADVVVMAPLAATLIASLDTNKALMALLTLIALTAWTFLLRTGLINPVMSRGGGAPPDGAGPHAGDVRNGVVSSAVTALGCAAMFLTFWYSGGDVALWQGVLLAAAAAVMAMTWPHLAANGGRQPAQWVVLLGKVLNALGAEGHLIGPECTERLSRAADQ